MCELLGKPREEILRCPARRAVYLTERQQATVKTLKFVDDEFMHSWGCVGHTPGVVINDDEIALIHTVKCLVTVHRGRRCEPKMCIHFVRATLKLVNWQYYYLAPDGYQRRVLLKIPAEDPLSHFFPESESRPDVNARLFWHFLHDGDFRFDKYEVPIPDLLAA